MPESAEMTVASDEDIITATLRGDIASFGTIVERHWSMVVALALSRIADPAESVSIRRLAEQDRSPAVLEHDPANCSIQDGPGSQGDISRRSRRATRSVD